MNKKRALEIAKDFVDDMLTDDAVELNLGEESLVYFSNEILEDDPNLEILKEELNKVGFDIFPAERPNWWNVIKK